jgi:hypothetical protein
MALNVRGVRGEREEKKEAIKHYQIRAHDFSK